MREEEEEEEEEEEKADEITGLRRPSLSKELNWTLSASSSDSHPDQ